MYIGADTMPIPLLLLLSLLLCTQVRLRSFTTKVHKVETMVSDCLQQAVLPACLSLQLYSCTYT
jgi:hypothetical protein